jgi:aminopeptidase N
MLSAQDFYGRRNILFDEWKASAYEELQQSELERYHALFKQNILIPHSYDVLHYRLDLIMPLDVTHWFSGKLTLIARSGENNLKMLTLNSVGLTINTVRCNGVPAAFQLLNQNQLGGQLVVTLDRNYAVGDSIVLDVDYAHTSTNNKGYYFYKQDGSATLSDLGYTFTEPYDSRYWFPCYDDPSDKATCEINVTVPAGVRVASNGKLVGVVNHGDTTTTFSWKEDHPIATYLMSVAASKYSLFSDFYRARDGRQIEIQYYVWQADSAGSNGNPYNAVNAFKNVPDMVSFYSRIFSEYPFDKYGMTAVQPFSAGGMEHQTITTIHRYWLQGFSEGGIAHELVHQWFGDMVTCATWGDIWLNEGFATYGDALYTEYKYGASAFQSKMRFWADVYLNEDSTFRYTVYNPPSSRLFGSTIYQKGAWVLHMLRYVLGDSTFFKIFPAYLQRIGYGTAVTAEFTSVVDAVAGQDMSWFFNQWIYQAGVPIYSYSWSGGQLGRGLYEVIVTLNQQQIPQSGTPAVFKMPVEFTVQTTNGDTTFRVWNDQRTQQFRFTVTAQPQNLTFDKQGRILKSRKSSLSSVGGTDAVPTTTALLQNFPNPFNPKTMINYELGNRNYVTLKVFDILGREVTTLVNEWKDAGKYSVEFDARNTILGSLASGVYFYRLRTNDHVAIKKMELIR